MTAGFSNSTSPTPGRGSRGVFCLGTLHLDDAWTNAVGNAPLPERTSDVNAPVFLDRAPKNETIVFQAYMFGCKIVVSFREGIYIVFEGSDFPASYVEFTGVAYNTSILNVNESITVFFWCWLYCILHEFKTAHMFFFCVGYQFNQNHIKDNVMYYQFPNWTVKIPSHFKDEFPHLYQGRPCCFSLSDRMLGV